jgi:hypothetical protein
VITQQLAEQVRNQVERLKKAQDEFLQTHKQLCVDYGAEEWEKGRMEIVFHRVRKEIIPIMEGAGMGHKAVQALCTWAEELVMHH